MSPESRPDRPSFQERREEKLEAKSRGISVEKWREDKTKNQNTFRSHQKDKLETSPLKLSFTDPKLAPKNPVEMGAWEGSYSSLLSFLKAAYEKSGESNPDQVNLKARAVQKFIVDKIGDDYLAMTSGAMLRFRGNTLELVGVHSNKYAKPVEEIVRDRALDAAMTSAGAPESHASIPNSPAATLTGGDQNGVRWGGTIPTYNPADDGMVQRPDGTWVSNGTKPQKSGPSTIQPAQL